MSPLPFNLSQEAIEVQLRQRLDLQGAHRSYIELKAKKDQAEKDEEETFRQQMMAKFAEDDRIEQMNAQKRRMKQLGEICNIEVPYSAAQLCGLVTDLQLEHWSAEPSVVLLV